MPPGRCSVNEPRGNLGLAEAGCGTVGAALEEEAMAIALAALFSGWFTSIVGISGVGINSRLAPNCTPLGFFKEFHKS